MSTSVGAPLMDLIETITWVILIVGILGALLVTLDLWPPARK